MSNNRINRRPGDAGFHEVAREAASSDATLSEVGAFGIDLGLTLDDLDRGAARARAPKRVEAWLDTPCRYDGKVISQHDFLFNHVEPDEVRLVPGTSESKPFVWIAQNIDLDSREEVPADVAQWLRDEHGLPDRTYHQVAENSAVADLADLAEARRKATERGSRSAHNESADRARIRAVSAYNKRFAEAVVHLGLDEDDLQRRVTLAHSQANPQVTGSARIAEPGFGYTDAKGDLEARAAFSVAS